MKRADLVAGEAYWYARTNDWLERESAGQKLVVVDTGFWHLPLRDAWSRDREPRKDTQGNGVLVDITERFVGREGEAIVRRKVVNLTQIRGPYEATLKKVREFDAARRARDEAAQAKSDLLTQQINEAIERANELGVEARRGDWRADEVILTVAEFNKLLGMASDE